MPVLAGLEPTESSCCQGKDRDRLEGKERIKDCDGLGENRERTGYSFAKVERQPRDTSIVGWVNKLEYRYMYLYTFFCICILFKKLSRHILT